MFNFKKRLFRLATPEECQLHIGFRPGSIPAVGLPSSVDVILDASICSHRPVLVLASPWFMKHDYSNLLISLSPTELHYLCEGARHADCSRVAEVEDGKSPSTSTGYEATRLIPLNPMKEGRDASEMRFLCDAMLSKLGRWLRVLGCDVVIFEEGRDRSELIDASTQLNRILLTKDRRRGSHASSTTKASMMKSLTNETSTAFVMLVEGNSTRTQLKEVTELLNLEYRREHFMSRCSTCNGKGFRDATIEEARASGIAAERVIRKVNQFWACLQCGKLYWEGPKFNSAKNLLEGYVSDLP